MGNEDCDRSSIDILPRHLWGAETYLHRTWGCARNLACPRLISLAPPELKPLSSFSISIRSTASSEESSTRTPPYLKRMAVRFYLQKGPRQSRCCQALFSIRWKSGVIFLRHRGRILSCTLPTFRRSPTEVLRQSAASTQLWLRPGFSVLLTNAESGSCIWRTSARCDRPRRCCC